MDAAFPETEIIDLINSLQSDTCKMPSSASSHVTPQAAAAARSAGIRLKRNGNLDSANAAFVKMYHLQDSICSDALWSWAKVLLLAKDFRHAQLLMHAEFANNHRGAELFNPFEWMNLHLNLPELDVEYLYDGSSPGYVIYAVNSFDKPRQLMDRIAEYGGNDSYWRQHYAWTSEDYAAFITYFSPLAVLALDDTPYQWTDDDVEETMGFYDDIYRLLVARENDRDRQDPTRGARAVHEVESDLVSPPPSEERSEHGTAPSGHKGQDVNLTRDVEECFYYNARCIGTCVFTGLINDEDKWYPEQFCDFLFSSASALSRDLAKLLDTESGRDATWPYPDDFKQVFQQEYAHDYKQYIVDVGKYAFFQETGGIGNYGRYARSFQRTSERAINRCLSLLRVAMREGAHDIVSVMLDGLGYMLGITSHYLLIQLFLRRMHNIDDAVFIPDKFLDSDDDSNRTSLRLYDQHLDDTTQMISIPSQMRLIWVPDGASAPATRRVELMGMTGILLPVTDRKVPTYLDTIAKNFVKGITY